MSACSLTHEKPHWGGNNKVCMELMANAHNTSSRVVNAELELWGI